MIDRCCISITEKCNLRCRYCHFTTDGRRSRDMTGEEIDSIIDSIRDYVSNNDNLFKVGIVGGGEPLLRFDMLKRIVEELGKDPHIRMYTISNGVGVDDEKVRFMWEHRDVLEYCISLDGSQMLHDTNRVDRSGNGTFSSVMDTVRRYEALFGNKPSVNCTVTPELLSHADETIRFFSENGFRKVTFSKLFDSEKTISSEEFHSFLNEASEYLEIRQLRKDRTYDCTQYGALCGVGRTNIYFASGLVYPCARFAGMSRYCIGRANDSMETIEIKLNEIQPCDDGLCYFDQYVRKGGIL